MAQLALRRYFGHRSLVTAVLVVAALALVAFGGRSAFRLYHRLTGPPSPPRQTNVQHIQPWMTVPFIGRRFGVPPGELFGALGVPDDRSRARAPLSEIARELGRTEDDILTTVRSTVTAFQAAHPAPSAPLDLPFPEKPGSPGRPREGPSDKPDGSPGGDRSSGLAPAEPVASEPAGAAS